MFFYIYYELISFLLVMDSISNNNSNKISIAKIKEKLKTKKDIKMFFRTQVSL